MTSPLPESQYTHMLFPLGVSSCEQYETRLESCKDHLMQVTLDDLYKDKAIVGDVLDDDYEPVPMSSGVVRAKRAMGFWMKKSPKNEIDTT